MHSMPFLIPGIQKLWFQSSWKIDLLSSSVAILAFIHHPSEIRWLLQVCNNGPIPTVRLIEIHQDARMHRKGQGLRRRLWEDLLLLLFQSCKVCSRALLNYLPEGSRKLFPCSKSGGISMYNMSPSDAFCFRALFKIYFFFKAHLETCYGMLVSHQRKKSRWEWDFFFLLMCAFTQRKKKKSKKKIPQFLNQLQKRTKENGN